MNVGWVTIISCTLLLFPIGGLLISMITSMTALASELPASSQGSSNNPLSDADRTELAAPRPRRVAAHQALREPIHMAGADHTAVPLHLES
jgi:hypothetical protein